MAADTRRKTVIFALLVIALMTPVIVAAMAGRLAWGAPWVYGGVCAVSAAVIAPRWGVRVPAILGATTAVAQLLNPYPLAGAAYLAILMFVAALTSRRGVHSVAILVPLFTSFALASPAQLGSGPAVNAALAGLCVVLGGLWVMGVIRLLLGEHLPRVPITPLTAPIALTYATATALVVGISAWAILAIVPTHEGAWMLVTLIVVMQPEPHDTVVTTLSRTAGTLLGVLLAAVIVILAPWPTADLVIVMLLLLAALVLRYVYKKPYWEYIALLTPAVVIVDGIGSDLTVAAGQRIGFTVLAGLIALVAAFVAKAVLDRGALKGSAPGHEQVAAPDR